MPSDSPFFLILLFFFFSTAFALLSVGYATIEDVEGGRIGSRTLLGLKESPHGTNATYECSPNGPCVACQYSEKNNDEYRCSETGYRIPLKCVEIKQGLKDAKAKKGPKKIRPTLEVSNMSELHNAEELGILLKRRSLLDDSSIQENEQQGYITYRSCIPAVNEEKLSVLGFEVIVLCLLVMSGSIVYFKKRQTTTMAGFSRIQSNARF